MIVLKSIYKVSDIYGSPHGTFSESKEAQEQAQKVSNELQKDVYITKVKFEIVDCVTPN
jgi:hypothetical protein